MNQIQKKGVGGGIGPGSNAQKKERSRNRRFPI